MRFSNAIGQLVGEMPKGTPDGSYRLRVWITHAHTPQPEPMTNPTRYATREDAAAVARVMGLVGLMLDDGGVVPGSRIYQVEVVDTRDESEAS
jgi:hypothetical protein